MQIFNIEIWGEDADKFMALSCAKKKEWIKTNTNQSDDAIIEVFLKAATRGNDDECHGCKEARKNEQNNQSIGVPKETASLDSVGESEKESNRTDTKGRGAAHKKS